MTRRYKACVPLYMMDSNPRDEEPDEPEQDDQDPAAGRQATLYCRLCGIEITPHEQHRCPEEDWWP